MEHCRCRPGDAATTMLRPACLPAFILTNKALFAIRIRQSDLLEVIRNGLVSDFCKGFYIPMKFRFLKYLWQETGPSGTNIAVNAIVAGVIQGFLIVVVSGATGNVLKDGLNLRYLALFVMSLIAFVITKRYSMNKISDQVQNLIFDLRVRLTDKVRNSSLVSFEKSGRSELYAAMMEHGEVLNQASRFAGDACSSAFMTIFCFVYIAVISMTALYISAAVTLVSVLHYLSIREATERDTLEALRQESTFLDYIHHVIDGFKEVKVNTAKSNDLFENHIKARANQTRDLKVKSERQLVGLFIFGQVFLYILLGAVVFLLPRIQAEDARSIGQLVAIILFMIGPLGNVVVSLPFLAKADAALVSIERLEKELDAVNDTRSSAPQSRIQPNRPFTEIRIEHVTFNHTDEKGRTLFTLGPIDLSLRAGEMTFIGGGNGSGKSTLLKLITGLYYPASGQILCDSFPVDMGNYVFYRNFFSIIFSDFHLFDRLYGLEDIDEDRVHHLLETMRLSDKTIYADGRFTNLNLSTGQRKRLAMIASRLEKKQIYVFDEVAADQDPVFRRYFYEVFLKDLKAEGKTILAATHDDRYFHVADRLLKMEEGRLIDNSMAAVPL